MPLINRQVIANDLLNNHLSRVGANKFNSVRREVVEPGQVAGQRAMAEREALYKSISPDPNWIDNLADASLQYQDMKYAMNDLGPTVTNPMQAMKLFDNNLRLPEDTTIGSEKAYDWVAKRAASLGHPVSSSYADFPSQVNKPDFSPYRTNGFFIPPQYREREAGIFVNDVMNLDDAKPMQKLRLVAHELGHGVSDQYNRYGSGFEQQQSTPPMDESVAWYKPAAETEAEAVAYGVMSKLYPHRARGRDLAESVNFIKNVIPEYKLSPAGDGDDVVNIPPNWGNSPEMYLFNNREFLEEKVNQIIPKARKPFSQVLPQLYKEFGTTTTPAIAPTPVAQPVTNWNGGGSIGSYGYRDW